MFYLFFP